MYAAAVYSLIGRPLSLKTPAQSSAIVVAFCTVASGDDCAIGGPAGTSARGSLVFHTESAVYAPLRGLTVHETATPFVSERVHDIRGAGAARARPGEDVHDHAADDDAVDRDRRTAGRGGDLVPRQAQAVVERS